MTCQSAILAGGGHCKLRRMQRSCRIKMQRCQEAKKRSWYRKNFPSLGRVGAMCRVHPSSGTSYHLLPHRGEGRNIRFTLHSSLFTKTQSSIYFSRGSHHPRHNRCCSRNDNSRYDCKTPKTSCCKFFPRKEWQVRNAVPSSWCRKPTSAIPTPSMEGCGKSIPWSLPSPSR